MKPNPSEDKPNQYHALHEDDTFQFDCHSGVACFTRCCRDADMYLYPYDIIRMKNRLSLSSDEFLEKHTFSAFRDNPGFPNIMLKMSDSDDKSCPFLSSKGCTIYEDRPFSCRAYPLERAVARGENKTGREVRYFVTDHAYCLGHGESRKWTINEWTQDQQMHLFNDMNDLWVDMDTLFRHNPWGTQGIENPAFKMAFMACFNVDKFKAFIIESTFLSRFDLSRERIGRIMVSDVELMKFGFDWTTFFLTGAGPLTQVKTKP